ncbi:MAG: response regulator [Bacteroidales bacterium]
MNVEVNPKEFKILVVDDVVSNVILLKALLTKEQYVIVTATNGEQALSMLDKEKPDLVLLDVMMPGMNGFEVAQKMKDEPLYSDIPIIFLTALNSSSDIVQGFKMGANDFISKPFNKEELIIRITHQISLVAAKRIIIQQNEELKSTIGGRDKLYSVIAHDLRSPMGSMKMVLNMLSGSLTKEQIGDDLYEFLNVANQTAENTFSLLDNLLKWTKSQIGRLNVVFQDTDISELIADIIDIFLLIAQVKNIKLEFINPKNHIQIRGDIDMMKTIMRNLLSNAVKYSRDGGKIEVFTEDAGDFVYIHVKDNGLGIKKEDQGKLLNMSSHFTTFGTANEEGSGLGLLLVKDFVEKNGGKFWFTSQEGVGSTFSFSVVKVKL